MQAGERLAGRLFAAEARVSRLVMIAPGERLTARMPSAAWSTAIERVSEITAALLALYAAPRFEVTLPSCEAMFSTTPPPAARMCGIACFAARKAAVTLTAKWRCQSSSAMSATGARAVSAAALFTRMCSPPKWRAASSTARFTAAGSVRSQPARGNSFGSAGLRVQRGDARAGRDEAARDRGADVAGGAGDQRDAPCSGRFH